MKQNLSPRSCKTLYIVEQMLCSVKIEAVYNQPIITKLGQLNTRTSKLDPLKLFKVHPQFHICKCKRSMNLCQSKSKSTVCK